MNEETKIVVLYGGGLDSAAMATFAHQQYRHVHLLMFDYGQKAFAGEKASLEYVAAKFSMPFTLADISPHLVPTSPLTTGAGVTDLALQAQNEVPARNLMFLSLAFSFACRFPNVHTIWLGADVPVTGGGFNDQKQPFLDGFNATTAFAYGERSPRVVGPLLSYRNKVTYLQKALTMFPELFARSFSCYESRSLVECGKCNHCQSKARARELIYTRATEHDERG